MKSFYNRGIGVRIAISFSVVIALIAGTAGLTAYEVSSVEALFKEAKGPQAQRASLAAEWHESAALNAERALAIGLSMGALEPQFAPDMKALSRHIDDVQKRFTALETSSDGKAAVMKLADARATYIAATNEMLRTSAAGNEEDTKARAIALKPVIAAYISAANAVVDFEASRSRELDAQMEASTSLVRTATFAAAVVCALLAALLGWLMTRSIVTPLAAAQKTADRIASGDLSVDLRATSADEVGKLTESLSRMQVALRQLVGGIRLSAESIGVASAEVAMGNSDLSARTEQSASSLQQTASSVEQISSTVRQSAESAREATKLALNASEVAKKGGAAVSDVVAAMGGIQASSQKISEIIGTIDGIAFQTNILALNAAVEAARAGEQGRGFAVVASEVRSLAQRSALAAKEIKALIAESVERVSSGAKNAQAAGETLADVVVSVRHVADLVSEISTAATEQSQGISEINQAVSSLDQATQQNSALVEQSAAAAASLREQAQALEQSVRQFRLAA